MASQRIVTHFPDVNYADDNCDSCDYDDNSDVQYDKTDDQDEHEDEGQKHDQNFELMLSSLTVSQITLVRGTSNDKC